MTRPEWLKRETELWEADGTITSDQRRAILSRYPTGHREQLTSLAFVWLAWFVAGFGLILLVAWNWAAIPGSLKVGGTTVVALTFYGAAWQAWRRGRPRRAELLAFAAALATGAVTAAVVDAFHVSPDSTMPMLSWAAAISVTALVAASPITTALGVAVLFFWALMDAGSPPASWPFLLVFPLLALALERRPDRYAAGAATLAFGAWVALAGLDTWRSDATIGMLLLAAGAALDVWAHQQPGRRPAFARVTPALALLVAGLVFQGVIALHGTAAPPVLAGDPAVVGPGFALIGALTLVAVWPSAAQRAAHWRPMVFGGLVVVWAVSALAAGGRTPVPVWWFWTWTALSSVALVVLTVSAVREGAVTDDRGLFAVGVAAMIALVGMHLTGEANRFGRSALVLFAAAGVLWWMGRGLRDRSDPQTP